MPVPDELTDERAVFVRLANVSMTTMRTTIAHGGDGVAVVGLGLIGNLAAQVFQACGMRVNALDLSPARRAIAERCGIRARPRSGGMSGLAQQHRLVVEATGSAEALAGAIGLAQNGGEIVMIGAPWGGDQNSVPSTPPDPRPVLPLLDTAQRLRVGDTPVSRSRRWPTRSWQHPDRPRAGSQDGRLKVEPLITHRLSPAEIQHAYEGLLTRKTSISASS